METIPAKITVRLENEMDELIREGWFANRSELIRTAVRDLVRRTRLEQLETAIKEDITWGLKR
jgi:Arc/MetJ-type ribon-helix-helix transcriptional regulator